jgi:hypothetical protein
MTRRRKDIVLVEAIHPDQFYRVTLSPALFDLGWQATANKIRAGELPRPFPLHEGSRLLGWTGRQILEHRAHMQALAEAKALADAARPKQRQPAALKKVKKVRLRARRGRHLRREAPA